MIAYIVPISVFLILGVAAGAILTFASRVFHVETDDRVEKIMEELPGINCGACGFSGCEGYAKALVEGKAAVNLCKPGGAKTTAAVGDVLGISAENSVRETAFVHCNGNCDATGVKYEYSGAQTCAAVERYYNGRGVCKYSCSGYGDCARVCDSDAIEIVNGVAVINPAKCTACTRCVKECPNNLISLRTIEERVQVVCSSKDNGKTTKAACKNGCIACRICEKKCPEGAITVNDNHASVDGKKCTGCGICIAACPTKCIHMLAVCGS